MFTTSTLSLTYGGYAPVGQNFFLYSRLFILFHSEFKSRHRNIAAITSRIGAVSLQYTCCRMYNITCSPAEAHLFITAHPISFQIPLPRKRHCELYIQTGFISAAFPHRRLTHREKPRPWYLAAVAAAAALARLITCHFLPSHNSIKLTRRTRHSRPVTQSPPCPFSSLADKRQWLHSVTFIPSLCGREMRRRGAKAGAGGELWSPAAWSNQPSRTPAPPLDSCVPAGIWNVNLSCSGGEKWEGCRCQNGGIS